MRKILNKRIPVGIAITVLILIIHITFVFTYFICQRQFNDMLIDLNLKQNLFEKLSVVDEKVRSNFYKNLDENLISDNIIHGYISSLNDKNTKYLTQSEYIQEKLNALKYTSDDEENIYYEYTPDAILYICISDFKEDSKLNLQKIIGENIGEDTKGVVFDLRDNSCENMEFVADCLTLFIPGNEAIIEQVDKNSTKVALYNANDGNLPVPCSVMINENTANAAEIFASALKDELNAKLVGTNTAGKTTKTEVFVLNDGSAVKVSVAQYVTSSGKKLDNIGLAADITVSSEKNENQGFSISSDKVFEAASDILLKNQ